MITQEQLPMVAMQSMNDTHLEDILIINRLSHAIDAQNSDEVNVILQELIAHTITHFSGEEEMMREKMFPPYPVHKGEHDRALNELKSVAQQFNENRDLGFVKSYVNATLIPWLINHIETLDTVTAMFLTQGISPCHSGAC
jgi:hemerythrin